jgi:hypothetical protein
MNKSNKNEERKKKHNQNKTKKMNIFERNIQETKGTHLAKIKMINK